MKNIAIKFLYIIIIVIFGTVVFMRSKNSRLIKYRDNELMEYLYTQDNEQFVEAMMVVMGSNKYISKPIQTFQAESEEFSFILDVYHYRREVKDEVYDSIIFNLRKLNIENMESKVKEYDEYLENKDLVGINVKIRNSEKVEISNQNIGISKNNKATFGSSFGPIGIKRHEDKSFFQFNNNKRLVNRIDIERIEFSIIDGTGEEITFNDPFAVLSNGSETSEFNRSYEFVNENNVLICKNFIGDPEKYEVFGKVYNTNDNIKVVDDSVLNKYNSEITKSLIIYSIIILIITFIFFFLKPFSKKIKERKLK